MKWRTGIGQDSHRFRKEGGRCIIGGIQFDEVPGLEADSDGDVVLHAICNAITSITHVPILGGVAIEMCHKRGIKESHFYLEEAVKSLGKWKIEHIALAIEGGRPRLQKRVDLIRSNVAKLLNLDIDCVGLTVTSGDGLTDFARGEGLQCFAIATFSSHEY